MYERLEFEQANLASDAALDATSEPVRLYPSSCGVPDKAGDRYAGRALGRWSRPGEPIEDGYA